MKKSYFEFVLSKSVACKYFWQKKNSVIDIISTFFQEKVDYYQQFASLKKMWLMLFWRRFFIFCICLFFSVNSLANLSTTSKQSIMGSEPYILLSDLTKLTNLSQLQTIQIITRDGSSNTINATNANRIMKAPQFMRFSDVKVLLNVPADGSYHNLVGTILGDDDGDNAEGTISGTIKATWYDENNQQVPNHRLGEELWHCGGPFTLKIEVNNVSVATKYGNPRSRFYGNGQIINYIFLSGGNNICFLKPKDMTIRDNSYNATIFYPNKGFIRSTGFPSTGFQYASFSLMGPGPNQGIYRCYISHGWGKISLSTDGGIGQNCTITYQSATKADFINSGTPVITMEYHDGQAWQWLDSFTIPIPSKWALGGKRIKFGSSKSLTTSLSFPGLDYCSGGKTTMSQAFDRNYRIRYMYGPYEITSDFAGFVRGMGSFMAEWGILRNYGGVWNNDSEIWTADDAPNNRMYRIYGITGGIQPRQTNDPSTIMICRGD